jgi:dTMP kinase
MDSRGGFIVIDGTDGSGKATQTKLLIERLVREGYPAETVSFPQYGKKSCGLVEEYLAGTYGNASEVGPYRASIFYAADRFDASQTIRCWLEAGKNVVADRYVGSNMGHQGSKITDPVERGKFFDWEMHLEHELFGIPRPDMNVVLHVPSQIAMELMKNRESKHGLKQDVHEQDPKHLQAAEDAYLDMTKRFESFQLVECVENGALLSPETIHERVWKLVQPYLMK